MIKPIDLTPYRMKFGLTLLQWMFLLGALGLAVAGIYNYFH